MDEPAFAEAIVARCTSPVLSSYDDVVANRLALDVQSRGKEFNIAAARYAVDLARALAVINSNNVWDENGHLVNLVASVGEGPWDTELELNPSEKLLHFRLFLQADGATLVSLARTLLSERRLPRPSTDWNEIASDLFAEIYSEYLAATSLTADRVSLRAAIDRFHARGYRGRTGNHKLFLHLQTLSRLGLIHRLPRSSERVYEVSEEGASRLGRLVRAVPNVLALEEIVREHRYVEVAAHVYGRFKDSGKLDSSEVLKWILPAYRQVMCTGVAICPLAPIVEATQIALLTERSLLVGYGELLDLLIDEQKLRVRDIRFHQDRRGRPAFLRISEELICDMGG